MQPLLLAVSAAITEDGIFYLGISPKVPDLIILFPLKWNRRLDLFMLESQNSLGMFH